MTYEEYLDKNGELTYTNVGVSMLPLLKQGRDLFTVRKKTPERCKKGDVVLYRRPPDKYVLHRIIEVRSRDYVILGDNCIRKEYGISDSDILGVMTAFVRKGREHSVTDRSYQLYSRIWVSAAELRIRIKKAWLAVRHAVKRVVRIFIK